MQQTGKENAPCSTIGTRMPLCLNLIFRQTICVAHSIDRQAKADGPSELLLRITTIKTAGIAGNSR